MFIDWLMIIPQLWHHPESLSRRQFVKWTWKGKITKSRLDRRANQPSSFANLLFYFELAKPFSSGVCQSNLRLLRVFALGSCRRLCGKKRNLKATMSIKSREFKLSWDVWQLMVIWEFYFDWFWAIVWWFVLIAFLESSKWNLNAWKFINQQKLRFNKSSFLIVLVGVEEER